MTESDFLITLPSNSNMSTHPSNEPANYTVKLAEPLQLEGDWEAGLVSVQYTPNWLSFNQAIKLIVAHTNLGVPKHRYPAIYRSKSGNALGLHSLALMEVIKQIESDTTLSNIPATIEAVSPNEVVRLSLITIQPKYYESVEALGSEICKLVKEAFYEETVHIRYIYDVNLKRGQFITSGCEILIISEFTTILGDLLGHSQKQILCSCNTHVYYVLQNFGNVEPRLSNVNSLWIYSNITQNQQVGDSKVPLLGIIPAQSADRKRAHYTVNPVHFQALNRYHICEINIQIVDDLGKRIPFNIGKTEDNLVCCLRFRRRKTSVPI